MSSNPFAALLDVQSTENIEENPSPDDDDVQIQQSKTTFQNTNSEKIKINHIIENIFYFTINKNNKKNPLVLLDDLADNSSPSDACIDLELLEQALFERILLENPQSCVIPKLKQINPDVYEKDVLLYLYKCYQRLKEYQCAETTKDVCRGLIIRNVLLALQQQDLFQGQDITAQLLEMIKDQNYNPEDFFIDISNDFNIENENSLNLVLTPVLKQAHMDAARASLVNVDRYIYTLLEIFSSNEKYATILLDHCTPANQDVGIGFANTLIGALLCLSILPKTFNGRHEYFDSIGDQTNTVLQNNLWSSTSALHENLHRIFLRLLKCSKTIRNRTLTWLAQCLRANAGRGKLWNSHAMDFNPAQFSSVGDGFMINLGNLLLRLCQPFCSTPSNGKILKVDPTYCAVPENECINKEVHMRQLYEETCLIPVSSDDDDVVSEMNVRPTAASYNFVTECFYLAHRSLDLGFRVCSDHLVRMIQDLGQIERAYNDAMNQSAGTSDIVDTMKQRLLDSMTKYLSMRAVLLEPNQLTMLSQFNMSTATWLTQVAINLETTHNGASSYAPQKFRQVSFPLPDRVPDTLKCIPEFVIENTVGYLSFLRKFNPQTLESQGFEFLDPILTMVLVFMGSPQRMRNPHLRARMAECLEALLPYHKDMPDQLNSVSRFQRERLFINHPFRKEIVRNILDVFVGIEMTGQSVQFEQKFNYRRPMYILMDYLWQLEEHRGYFKQLAEEAEQNMDAVTPPLFLRFVNLLMNDAVFLLDESLSNMAQLKTMQNARENGEWNSLPQEERTQNLGYIQHIGMIARFDNILGRETIHTLGLLTSEINRVFTHTTMVDRVAAMLNYFLFNLVGPNKKNFKVKDFKEYEFDPANTVLNICKIYVHLYESDAFCLAVSQDGRSYSPQLFGLAEDVLARIGGGALISELQNVAAKVSELATQQEAEEEALTEAPEEFLDPIMSTLMMDPVILPSSKQIVDRNTIARHLLSDQTDPFNRSPLTMDQVIPNTELADRIKSWIAERHTKRN